jgi:hypothetical protein
VDLEQIRSLITASTGRTVSITPVGGDPQLLSVVSVDKEGFTYHLFEEGQDELTLHWWPLDEIAEVHSVGTK